MTTRNRQPRGLSDRQRRRKEQILTQPEPAKVRETASAVVLKQGSLFLLAPEDGDVPAKLPHGFGLFYEDCRYLDEYTLTLNGLPLIPLAAADTRGFETDHHLANPALPRPDGAPPIAKNTLTVHRRRLIRGGVLHERIVVRNYGNRPMHVRLELRFGARFEDIFILKGIVSRPRGSVRPPRRIGQDTVELGYDGRDSVQRTTTLVFAEPPDVLGRDCAAWSWTLEPGATRDLAVSITPSEHKGAGPPRRPARPRSQPERLRHWPEHAEQAWRDRTADVRSSNELFDRVLRRSLLDLRLLRSRRDGLHYFAAGIPWFVTLFGRDAATVAIQTMPYGQRVAGETLQLLARYQATALDAYRDAEPGKILHELRSGELAQARAIPQSPAYYGTVDATLLFIILLAEYVNWSGDVALARSLRPALDAALSWIEVYADHDGDGYLDYVVEYENGLINMCW